MTDQNTTPAEAVERVAKALQGWDDGVRFRWDDLHPDIQDRYHRQATAAIEEHTAYLRERSRQPDVVEAAAQQVRAEWVGYCLQTGDTKPSHIAPWEELSEWDKEADRRIAFAALTALLGPRPEGESDE